MPNPPGRPSRTAGSPRERALELGVHAVLGLVVLTPLVVLPDILFAHGVGKAVYARSLIAVGFALWAVLAALRPGHGVRPGALPVLFAATVASGALAAPFGASLRRSLWSEYTRMGGLIDAAHWVALAFLLVAMLRTARQWRRLLNLYLAVGCAAALLAVARFHAPEAAGLASWPEPWYPRIAMTLGNPIFLGAYMQAVALVAAGFLARSFLGAPAPAAARAFWGATAVLAVWALALAGSMGALAGLAAGAGGAALFYGSLGPSLGARRAGRLACAGLVLAGAALAVTLAARSPGGTGSAAQGTVPGAEAPVAGAGGRASGEQVFDIPVLERVTSVERIGSTLGTRLENWRSGLLAFAERPLLGWGPENYLVAASRHDRTGGEDNWGIDRAHNLAVEKAATEGVVGLLAWLALWSATAAAVWRAARRSPPPQAALAAFAGAALLGWFVQGMTAFHDAVSWLTHALLLAFLAHAGADGAMRGVEGADAGAAAGSARRSGVAWTAPVGRIAGWPWMRGLLAAAVVALAVGSLSVNRAIHAGAAALFRAENGGPFMGELERSILAFEPMATFPRILLFENVASNWAAIHDHDPAQAGRLIDRAEAEAVRAFVAEPRNWQLHHALAKMYTAVAATHPAYEPSARFFMESSRELAPYQDPLMPARPRGEAGLAPQTAGP